MKKLLLAFLALVSVSFAALQFLRSAE